MLEVIYNSTAKYAIGLVQISSVATTCIDQPLKFGVILNKVGCLP